MKKLLLLLSVTIFLASCSMDPDPLKFTVEFIPVSAVEVPETMQPGQTYEIKVKYTRPDDCHYFDGFYHEMDGAAHVFAIQTIVIADANCAPVETLVPEEASFEFSCPLDYQSDNYVFKFYQGEDATGNQQFLEMEIPVQQ